MSHVLHATVDDLKTISIGALTAAVKASCTVVLFLGNLICLYSAPISNKLIKCCASDDETANSQWVVHEVKTAQVNQIPIITVIDIVSALLSGCTIAVTCYSLHAESLQPARADCTVPFAGFRIFVQRASRGVFS